MSKTTKQLIDQYHIKAKKKFGQNFLLDKNIINKIVEESKINSESIVIEIGPGLGALTQVLLKKAKKVIAYEIDSELVTNLSEILQEYQNITIINKDFLEVDLEKELDEFIDEELIVCANLPYYITTPILFKIFEANVPINKISVMMQREVADRFVAMPKTKDYNALSVITQYKYKVSMIVKVSKTVFYPTPNVDSAVVLFERKNNEKAIDEKLFFEFVKACFKQRRKTIYNNLKQYEKNTKVINEILASVNINVNTRSEELSLNDFIDMFECYKQIV